MSGTIGNLLKLVRSVDRAFEVQEKHGAAIQKLTDGIAALEKRVTALEMREEVVIARCEGAAAASATSAAAVAMADLARRLGAMEERGRLGRDAPVQRLSGPAED
ncbi:hypothetical protein [Muricoccus radiodurans]|uniref:hypothetical protein n=1 Tax=Muricoccus radiodurans TaxID=2231721 RepID=UPI003CF20ECC